MMLYKKKATKKIDGNDLNTFYLMLKKMQKKRPNFNIKWVMTGLYGLNYTEFINDK